MLPLCQKLEGRNIADGVGLYYLKNFEICHWNERDGWHYKIEKNSINSCIDEIMRYFDTYLIPFFDCANSCKTALPELIKLEQTFNDIRRAGLKLDGIEDKEAHGDKLFFLDSSKCYMALKNGDYAFALKCLEVLLTQNVVALQSLQNNRFITEESMKERRMGIEKMQNEICQAKAENTDYFQSLMSENEAYTRESLKNM